MDFKDVWDIVKTLLALSVILLPVIGKLIEKSLKSAGKVGQQKKIHDVLEPFYGKRDEDEDDEEDDDEEATDEAEFPDGARPVPEHVMQQYVSDVRPVVQPPAELLEGSYKSIKDIVKERQEARKTEEKDVAVKELDIDPKKLVIYSEIMNTKF